jgi:signal transduction histidine kinase
MQVEILLAVVVLAVAILVAVDLLRRSSDPALEYAERLAHDVGPHGPPPSGRSSPPADGRQHPDTGTATPRAGPPGVRANWHVRTRLSLLAAVAAVAAVLVTAGSIRAAGALGSAAFHSDISSVHDGAVVSALLACAFAVVVLAVGLWSVVLLTRSVLRPLYRLRAGAVELAEVRLPHALRYVSQAGGEGRPVGVKSVGVSSSDEIGEIARAFDQVQREALRLAANEAGLRERLGEMFVDMARRSQSLLERQTRLIDGLEHGERDTGRLADLLKMDHLAARMRRYSQNLLILAGQEQSGRLNQPVTLTEVIRAAVTEIEEYERVSFSAQPGIAISGPAVNDVVHLIAELAENASSLSGADTPVDISGHALASGGVLIDITDQGVGMSPDRMAQANWRLENPSAAEITAARGMGLIVAGRLAARHDARVRLQPAESGGLTALVWLPDTIVVWQDAAASPGFGDFRPGPGPREDAGPGWPAGPEAGDMRMPVPAPTREDVAVTAARRRIPAPVPDAAQRPGPARPPAGPPPPDGPRLAKGLRLRPVRPRPPAPEQPPEDGVAPSAENPAAERRLPIYEAVESDWFRSHRKAPRVTAAAEDGWESPVDWVAPVDEGWLAAEAAAAPSSGGVTTSGLPVRVPRANLVPGAVGSPQASGPAPPRSASAARDRLAGFQRGTSQGRATAGGGGYPGGEDET